MNKRMVAKGFAIGLATAVGSVAMADDNDVFWTGAEDAQWSKPANWSPFTGDPRYPGADDVAKFTNEVSEVLLDGSYGIQDLYVEGNRLTKVYTDNAAYDPAITNTLTITDLYMLQDEGATFEASGSNTVVEATGGSCYLKGTTKATGGAKLKLANAKLGSYANQQFVAEGAGTSLTICNLAWKGKDAGVNTNVVFDAKNGCTILIDGAISRSDEKLTIRADRGEIIGANSFDVYGAVDLSANNGSYVDLHSLRHLSGAMDSTITIDNNSKLRLRDAMQLGVANGKILLDLISGKVEEVGTAAVYLGTSGNTTKSGMLTIKLHPTPASSETDGLIQARTDNSKCLINLYAGVKFSIDCEGLRGFVGQKKMMVMQQTYASGAHYEIPTEACVTLTGENVGLCTAAFTQEGQNLFLTMTCVDPAEPRVELGTLKLSPGGTMTVSYDVTNCGADGTNTVDIFATYCAVGEETGTEVQIATGVGNGAGTGTIEGLDKTKEYTVTIYAKNELGAVSKSTEAGWVMAREDKAVTYTWKGGASGIWRNENNWDASVTPCIGWPDEGTYATASFKGTDNVTVDLDDCGMDVKQVTWPQILTIANGRVNSAKASQTMNDLRLILKDGGCFRGYDLTGNYAIFKSNTAGSTIELAGNGTFKGVVNTYTYSTAALAQQGNTVYAHGTGNTVDGVIKNQAGNLFVIVQNGDLTITDNMQAFNNSYSLVTSVSNATVTCKAFTSAANGKVAATSMKRTFNVFVPAKGLAAAPIAATTTTSELGTNTFVNITCDKAFPGGKIPLLGGIKSYGTTNLPANTTVSGGFTVEYSLENNILWADLKRDGFILFVK